MCHSVAGGEMACMVSLMTCQAPMGNVNMEMPSQEMCTYVFYYLTDMDRKYTIKDIL